MTSPSVINRKRMKAEFAEALAWLKSLGIDYSPTRFGKYGKDIELLEMIGTGAAAQKSKGLKSTNDSYDSALEAHDLITIYRGLSSFKDSKFIEKLKIFIGGPIHSADEKLGGASSLARNTGLELLIASHFALGSFKVDFSTLADTVVIDKNTFFHIECKRPFKYKTIKKNLDKAYSQLKRRYSENDQDLPVRGFVVLSIGKILNPENNTLRVKDESELLKTIGILFRDFLDQHKTLWKRNLHDQTMAVFAYLQIAVSFEKLIGTLIHRQFDGIYVSLGHDPDIKNLDPDRLYFNEIVSRLNEGARNAFQN